MTLVWSGILLTLNSIVLYIVPEGRVAYWADWLFFGLTKTEWGDQHITVGVLFLIAAILHIYYNWSLIVAYMKNKARQLKIFTLPSAVGLVLTLVFMVGTYWNVPPMSTILDFSGSFKEAASQKYGEPPYGHAELSSLKMFCRKEGLDLEKAIELLASAGLKVPGSEMTIKELANASGRSPQQVYDIFKAAGKDTSEPEQLSTGGTFPQAPVSGWGRTTLSAVCQKYNLQIEYIVAELAARDIDAAPDQLIKDIAGGNDMETMELFEVLYEIVNTKK